VQRERAAQRQVVGRAPDPDADLSRLDDPLAGPAAERRPVGVDPERDPAPFARLQRDPGEAGQPAHRAHHRGDRVAEVELDDLGARPRPAIPLSRPALITVGILAFVTSWNAYLLPLVVFSSQDHYTLPLAVANFQSTYTQDTARVYAFTAVSMIPALAIFIFAQRKLVGGLVGAIRA
jgi:hypothetical protein